MRINVGGDGLEKPVELHIGCRRWFVQQCRRAVESAHRAVFRYYELQASLDRLWTSINPNEDNNDPSSKALLDKPAVAPDVEQSLEQSVYETGMGARKTAARSLKIARRPRLHRCRGVHRGFFDLSV